MESGVFVGGDPLEVPETGTTIKIREAASAYGNIRAAVERRGNPVGSMDLLIPVHAISLEVPLVTNNVKEFRRIPALRVENWV